MNLGSQRVARAVVSWLATVSGEDGLLDDAGCAREADGRVEEGVEEAVVKVRGWVVGRGSPACVSKGAVSWRCSYFYVSRRLEVADRQKIICSRLAGSGCFNAGQFLAVRCRRQAGADRTWRLSLARASLHH